MKSGGELAIRPVRESDVPLLLNLIRELADFVQLSVEVQTDERTLQESLFGSRPAAEALLAFADNDAVGYAVFFSTFSTFLGRRGLYLEDLFIRTRFRQRGYGRALFEHIAREANRRQCPRFEWAVLAWNKPAIHFYENFGATVLPDNRTCRLSGAALTRLGR